MTTSLFRQSAKLYRPIAMTDIAIDAVTVDHDAGAQLNQHMHEQGQLSLVVRGTLAIMTQDGWWVTPPGRYMQHLQDQERLASPVEGGHG